MIAYKATYDMRCISLTYEVGKTYTFNGELKICETGFHCCKKAIDVLKYYDYKKDFKLLEIEILGDMIDDGNKTVTNKIKILRVISTSEYPELLGITLDSNGNITKKVDSDGSTWTYEYDSNQNQTKQVNPDGSIWTFEYDSNGNMTKKVYPHGSICTC